MGVLKETLLDATVQRWVIDQLRQRFANIGRLDRANMQGTLAELVVAKQLGDADRVIPLLDTWRTAENGATNRVGRAANCPDWLILNADGQIAGLVEVKAVASDRLWIVDAREEYVDAWKGLPQLTANVNEKVWKHRVAKAWPTNGQQFASQLGHHFDRLKELAQQGVLPVVDSPKARLYVPAGEDYSEVPGTIKVKDAKGETIVVPLELSWLPSLAKLSTMIDEAMAEVTVSVAESKPTAAERQPSESPAAVVKQRLEQMKAMLPSLTTLLRTTDPEELDQRLGLLLIGPQGIQNRMRPELTIEAKEPDSILQALGSTAPRLIAHFLFEAGGRPTATSKADKQAFEKIASNIGAELNADHLSLVLSTLIKLRDKIAKKGYELPPLPETLKHID